MMIDCYLFSYIVYIYINIVLLYIQQQLIHGDCYVSVFLNKSYIYMVTTLR